MERLIKIVAMAAAVLLLGGGDFLSAEAALPPPPDGTTITLPPFSNTTMVCSFDPAINAGKSTAMPICVQSYPTPGQYIYLCDDDKQVSARYQYKKKVQLWKKGSAYAASFSTWFTFEISPEIENDDQGIFGSGLAFAITPSLSVGTSGFGSLGLFEIDRATGKAVSRGKKSPKTLAVEIDLDRDSEAWDLEAPHVGLDLNSLRSSEGAFLWDGSGFAGRRIAAFIDYDAARHKLEVRFQNVSSRGVADKKKSKLFLSVSGLDLSKHVNERSYVGFSSRVPVTTHGVYYIYNWHFTTQWVLKKKKRAL